MGKMRGIALINILLKWYLATITLVIERLVNGLTRPPSLIVGGEKECGAALVYSPLQLLA